MSPPRFFVDGIQAGSSIPLPETEANHACKVLRLKTGDPVEVFDGCGHVGSGTIAEIGKRSATVEISQWHFAPNDCGGRLQVAVGLPKGDRQRIALEKFVELGGDVLIPLETEFGVAEIHAGNADRLQRYALEACKQCRRNRMPEIRTSFTIDMLCDQISASGESFGTTWVLHPSRDNASRELLQRLTRTFLDSQPRRCLFVIGPEGGLSDSEVDRLTKVGATPLSLGDRILRVETAVAAACMLGHLWLGGSPLASR
jgi:16S rRNA (uracil1498-N3)-methyltransferase